MTIDYKSLRYYEVIVVKYHMMGTIQICLFSVFFGFFHFHYLLRYRFTVGTIICSECAAIFMQIIDRILPFISVSITTIILLLLLLQLLLLLLLCYYYTTTTGAAIVHVSDNARSIFPKLWIFSVAVRHW